MVRYQPLRELYYSRLREFYRQPARIFWVYGFPTVLAVCLGLAFRSRPPESIQFDVVKNASSSEILQTLESYNATARPRGKPVLVIHPASAEEVLKRLKTAKTPLAVDPRPSQPL